MQIAEHAQVQTGTKVFAVTRQNDDAHGRLVIQPLETRLQLVPHGPTHGICLVRSIQINGGNLLLD